MVDDNNCIFCKIIAKEIPCYKIWEDENSLAFLDVKPHAKGHTIVIPKNHAKMVNDLTDENFANLMVFVKKVMTLLKEKLNPAGFNVGWNNGEIAGQVVPHIHIHIMPRYVGDDGGSMHSIISNAGDIGVEEVAMLFK
jgi:histidine triad (HIT) family protein